MAVMSQLQYFKKSFRDKLSQENLYIANIGDIPLRFPEFKDNNAEAKEI